MSSDTAYLPLLLDAPLMSWGFASRFTRRTTALHPTRSALTGMICAALGAAKGSDEERGWLERLDGVRFTTLQLPRQPQGCRQELAIRRLEDYHVTGGGYDKKRQALSIPRKASGGPCDNPTLSWRQYLLDARFAVLLAGGQATLEAVAEALRDPRWGVWFGRKCCIPAEPIVRGGVVATLGEALGALNLESQSLEEFERVEDAASFAEGTDTLMDAPVSFEPRVFKPRRINRQSPATKE